MVDDGGTAGDGADGGGIDSAAPASATDLERARALLDDETLSAFHVGVVRDGTAVETAFSHRVDGADAEAEGLRALTLLAAHVRLVADEAGVDASTAAADAAALAGRIEDHPSVADDD